MNEKEIMFELSKPFLPDEIEWRVGSTNQDKTKGLALAYVTNRAIQQRLDDIFGCFGWRNEFIEWKGKSQLCGISIKFNDEWITKWDGADDSNMEATKGGLSDAMKRAAYQWGIGRYLYKLPSVWCKLKQVGKSYALNETPQLPKWALPDGYAAKHDSPTPDATKIDNVKHDNPKQNVDTITEKQAKRLFAIASGSTKEEKASTVKMIMDKYGYKNTMDITKVDYNDICAEIETAPS